MIFGNERFGRGKVRLEVFILLLLYIYTFIKKGTVFHFPVPVKKKTATAFTGNRGL